MPRLVLNFFNSHDPKVVPTDEQLFLQLVYGLCDIGDSKEEQSYFTNSQGIGNNHVRRLCKALVKQLNLPVPESRVDEWIDFHRNNHCWVVGKSLEEEADRLVALTNK